MEEGAHLAIDERDGGVLLKAIPIRPSAEERRRLFEQFMAQVAATRADTPAWAEEQAERMQLESTLLDGLGDTGGPPRG